MGSGKPGVCDSGPAVSGRAYVCADWAAAARCQLRTGGSDFLADIHSSTQPGQTLTFGNTACVLHASVGLVPNFNLHF